MTDISRKLARARLMSEHDEIFQCPICASAMRVDNMRSLVCNRSHCFDISRQGYVNLMPHPVRSRYDKRLFEARQAVNQIGLFEPLIEQMCEVMSGVLAPSNPVIKVLDAGCGEGSHLTNIQQRLADQAPCDLLGVGIDIAKEGIHIASRSASNTIWCVADLARSPFAAKQFQMILSILSPSNYAEFQRLLADGGMVAKVIPEAGYLQELRETFYHHTDKAAYSNSQTLELFKRNFELLDIQRIQYSLKVEHTSIEQLIQMTPLSWNASEELVEQIRRKEALDVTCDFTLMLGKLRKG